MPRKGKKERARNFTGFSSNSDITLKDFANSEAGPGRSRMKKAAANSLASQVKELTLKPAVVVEEKDWFDKSLDEFEIESAPEDEEDENCRVAKPRRRKKHNSTCSVTESGGVDYPIDIWFILGEYIKPEDVATFACICKSAYAVTQVSKFWFRYYRRYYSPMEKLPMRLQPECMERLYALKAHVVRSLYYFYPVFLDRLKNRKEPETDVLLKRRCVMMWHQKGRMKFNYFFKLKETAEEDYHCRSQQPDLVEMLGDINANSEKRCKVLQITSLSFTFLPPNVLGQTLLYASSVLSSDLRSHCMRLVFGPPHAIHYSRKGKLSFSHIPEGSVGVSINSVVMVKILNWWDPMYPHYTGDEKVCVNESRAVVDDDFF